MEQFLPFPQLEWVQTSLYRQAYNASASYLRVGQEGASLSSPALFKSRHAFHQIHCHHTLHLCCRGARRSSGMQSLSALYFPAYKLLRKALNIVDVEDLACYVHPKPVSQL